MGLTIGMKKCVVSLQIESSALVWRETSWEFFWGNECVGAPQRPLGFATTLDMWDLIGCMSISTHIFCYLHVYW